MLPLIYSVAELLVAISLQQQRFLTSVSRHTTTYADGRLPSQLVHHQNSSEGSSATCCFLPLIPNGANYTPLEISSE